MDFLTLFNKGGVIMYAILLLSFVGIYISVERWLTLRKSKPTTSAFQLKLRKILENKNLQLAEEFCMQENSPAGRVVGAGLEKINYGPLRVRQAMEDQGREEVHFLERHFGILASIAGIAPMLGFLGTVTGMMEAFQAVAAAAGQPSPTDLADGIWEALLTTIFGLGVGIIAYGLYNYLVNATQALIGTLERVARDAFDAVEECVFESKTFESNNSTINLHHKEK